MSLPMICCKVCQEYSPAEDIQCVHCGAPLPRPKWLDSTLGMEQQIRLMLAEGYKIGAIKLYRDQTGASLKQAKDAVEAIEQGQPLAAVGKQEDSFEYQLIELLQAGRKIDAIKLFRERTGADLKQAKDAVEQIAAAGGITAASGSTKSDGAGCLHILLLVAALIVEFYFA